MYIQAGTGLLVNVVINTYYSGCANFRCSRGSWNRSICLVSFSQHTTITSRTIYDNYTPEVSVI